MADSSNENSGSRERSSSPSASATRRDDGAAAAVPPHRDEDESQLEDRQPEKRAGDFSSEAAVGKGGSALSVGWVDASVSTKPGLSLRCCGDRADSVVQLLHKQSGGTEGKFVVIMGPSGCGKTTFLNMIAKRFGAYQPGRETQLRVGGQSYSVGEFKAVSGYVLADDVLFPHLTVRETLLYGAKLRMPQETSAEEKSARVDQVIRRLGLEKCQHTPIGDSLIRGVSGGERKRVCIALELLNRPRVLLCDTLTSGLDSATAFSVCTLLADLAHSGECTVIASLNQPQIKIWNLIDQLILLYDGQLIYQGAPSRLIELYTEAGFACPAYINPADHILDVITPLFREDVPCIEANLRRLRDHLARQAADPVPSFEQRSIERNGTRSSWLQQFGVLIARATLSQVRDRFSVYLQLVQTLIMAVLVGAVFLDIGTDQTSIRLRQSVLFFCCINQGIFAALLAVNSYPADRNVVLRERAAGAYHSSAYFLAKMVVELLVQMIYPLVFSIVVYWMIGLQADAGKFFLFVLFMELCSLCAHAWAMLTSAICVTVNRSLSVLPLVFEVARLFGGFFLSPAELPAYFVWLDAISYVKYAYTGVSLNELDGLVYTCTPDQLVPPVNGTCPVTSGQQTIDALGLDYISMGGCIGVLFGLLIGLRFFNYIAMRFNKA